jgi:hypothetical protein
MTVSKNQERTNTIKWLLMLGSRLIGTVSNCNVCKASESWLGRFSPIEEIRNGKLSPNLTVDILIVICPHRPASKSLCQAYAFEALPS